MHVSWIAPSRSLLAQLMMLPIFSKERINVSVMFCRRLYTPLTGVKWCVALGMYRYPYFVEEVFPPLLLIMYYKFWNYSSSLICIVKFIAMSMFVSAIYIPFIVTSWITTTGRVPWWYGGVITGFRVLSLLLLGLPPQAGVHSGMVVWSLDLEYMEWWPLDQESMMAWSQD